MRCGDRRLEGYGWIFPLSRTEANIGVGVLDRSTPTVSSISEVLAQFCSSLVDRYPRFARMQPKGPVEGGALPVRLVDQRRVAQGALLVGDAAGFVNPYTGEGICYALESGELAALAAIKALRAGGNPNAWYGRQVRMRFPQQWALRGASRHLRWVAAAAAPAKSSTDDHRLIDAARAVALDLSVRTDPFDVDDGHRTRRSYLRLSERVVSRIVSAFRGTDVVLSEIVAELLRDGASSAACLLLIAGTIADDPRTWNRVFIDALATLAMLVVAQELTAGLSRASDDAAHGVSAATITLADCLLTEAMRAMACVPDTIVRGMTHATRIAATARRDLASEQRTSGAMAAVYFDLAAPADTRRNLQHRRLLWIASRPMQVPGSQSGTGRSGTPSMISRGNETLMWSIPWASNSISSTTAPASVSTVWSRIYPSTREV